MSSNTPAPDQIAKSGLPPLIEPVTRLQGFLSRWGSLIFFVGLVCTTSAPIFVRLSEIGPLATGAARLTFALPLLLVMLWFEPARKGRTGPAFETALLWPLLLSGLLFAADLAMWNSSVTLTSVANAAFLANFAPVFVVLGAWLLFKEKIRLLFLLGFAVAIAGSALMMSDSLALSETGFKGDMYSVVAAGFYAGYILTVSRVRKRISTMTLMTISSAVSAAALWVMAAMGETTLLPETVRGWSVILGTALLTQVAGQTLIALSLGYVSANFSALILLLQPIIPAFVAWLLFDESLTRMQTVGAVVIVIGLALARPPSNAAPTRP